MKHTAILLALAALLVGAGQAGEPGAAARQPFSKDILFPKEAGDEIFGVLLDSDVYRATRADFADLRLVAPDGSEVPYLIEKAADATAETVREPVPGAVSSIVEPGTNRLEILWGVDRDAAGPVSGLRFETPLKDFERKVSVYGEAGGDWAPLVTDSLLYDYTRFMDVRRVEVSLPATTARRLKIVIEGITDERASPFKEMTRAYRGGRAENQSERLTLETRPLRIDRIGAWRDKRVERLTKEIRKDQPIAGFDVEEDSAHSRTLITVRCRREPLTAFHIQTGSLNFSRAVEVEGMEMDGVRRVWKPIGRAWVSAIRFRSFSEEHLELSFPEQRREQYRLVIDNGDNAPLKIAGIRAEGAVHRLVLLRAGSVDGRCRLYYGSEDLRRPSYDVAAVLAAVRQGNRIVHVGLGPETANPDVASAGWAGSRLVGSKAFFTAAVILVVAVLSWGLFRAARHADKTAEK